MKDKRDMSERLRYLTREKKEKEDRREFYSQQLLKIKDMVENNKKEINYNIGWIKFHESAIENHKKQIQEAITLEDKKNQEQKLNFHIQQIENHHKRNVDYHSKEIEFLEKEFNLFEQGINKCEEQLTFLNNKIKENSKL